MRNLPEKDFLDTVRTRLRNYEEKPEKDDWELIAAAMKPRLPWYRRRGIAVFALLVLISGTTVWVMLPSGNGNNILAENKAGGNTEVSSTTRLESPEHTGEETNSRNIAIPKQDNTVSNADAANPSVTTGATRVKTDDNANATHSSTSAAGITQVAGQKESAKHQGSNDAQVSAQVAPGVNSDKGTLQASRRDISTSSSGGERNLTRKNTNRSETAQLTDRSGESSRISSVHTDDSNSSSPSAYGKPVNRTGSSGVAAVPGNRTGNGTTTSGHADAASGNGAATSGDHAGMSGNRVATSGNGTAVSGSGVTTSENAAAVSGNRVATSGDVVSDNGAATSGDHASISGNRATKSGNPAVVSGNGASTSGDHAGMSGNRVATSGNSAAASGDPAATSGDQTDISGNSVALSHDKTAPGNQITTSGNHATTSSKDNVAAVHEEQKVNQISNKEAATMSGVANTTDTISTDVTASDKPGVTSVNSVAGSVTDSPITKKDTIIKNSDNKKQAVAKSTKKEEQKRKAWHPVLYFSLTPSLAFQKITPTLNDDIHISSLHEQGLLSGSRTGISLEAGGQFTVLKGLDLYGGLAYYQQNSSITYDYTIPSSTHLRMSNSMDYLFSPDGGTHILRYTMRNAGVSAGFLYTIKDAKLMHRIGAGVQYQRGLMKAGSEDTYENKGSQYLNYQVHYRLEWAATRTGRTRLYMQPAFIHSFWSQETLHEPLTLKPYRVALSFGATVTF